MRQVLTGTLLLSAIAMVGLGTTALGAARPNPWCLKAAMGKSWVVDLCYFKTFAQCSKERFNYGNTSFCVHNPALYWNAKGEPRQPSPSEFP